MVRLRWLISQKHIYGLLVGCLGDTLTSGDLHGPRSGVISSSIAVNPVRISDVDDLLIRTE